MATTAVASEKLTRPAIWPRVLMLLGRLALGAIFVFAAFTKLYFNGGWHFGDYQFFFSMVISSYNILPAWAVQPAAQILPWFELLLGILLLAGIGLRWTGLMACAMLLIFIGAMTRAYMNGLEIMCGCFGNNEKLGPLTLLRDSSMLIPAIGVTIGAFLTKKRKATVSS
jgi:uncharacterized membrane protein YphA (DoxX/SURF4 family)